MRVAGELKQTCPQCGSRNAQIVDSRYDASTGRMKEDVIAAERLLPAEPAA